MKVQTIKVISVQDWDKTVRETYHRPYRLQQQDGCVGRQMMRISVPVEDPEDYENDSIPEKINGQEMGVSFKAWLARDPQEWKDGKTDKFNIELFWARNFYPSLDMVINDLHSKGLLEAGDYSIDIDW